MMPDVVKTDTGELIPVSKNMMRATPKLLMESMAHHLSMPANKDDPNSPSTLEALMQQHVVDAFTDPSVRKDILDRFCGKPMQSVQTVAIHASLEEWLNGLAEERDIVTEVFDV